MKYNWKRELKRTSTRNFERVLLPICRRLVRLYQVASSRQMWGDLVFDNSIHPSAFCSYKEGLTVHNGVSIGPNCRVLITDQGHITLDYVFLEPNVTLSTGSGEIEIGYESYINVGSFLWTESAKITIGRQVLIGPNCVLSAANHSVENVEQPMKHGPITSRGITVGDNVWIGAGAILCDGVTIGPDTIIAAGAVVTKDVPARVVAGGVPCRVIKARVPKEVPSDIASI